MDATSPQCALVPDAEGGGGGALSMLLSGGVFPSGFSTYYAFRLEARPYGDTGSTPYGTGSTAPPAWRLPLQAVVVAMDPTRATSCYGVADSDLVQPTSGAGTFLLGRCGVLPMRRLCRARAPDGSNTCLFAFVMDPGPASGGGDGGGDISVECRKTKSDVMITDGEVFPFGQFRVATTCGCDTAPYQLVFGKDITYNGDLTRYEVNKIAIRLTMESAPCFNTSDSPLQYLDKARNY
eukprot:XP_001698189.1 predicted protein [Chlamydomonas reinhardtii]